MTILLIILLASSPASAASANVGEDLRLPVSTTEYAPEENVTIRLSLEQLSVNGRKILDLEQGVVSPQAKEGGKAESFFIESVYRALERELGEQKKTSKHDVNAKVPGRVNVVADKRVTYRTLMEVLYSAGQARLGEYRFTVLKQDGTAGVLHASAPKIGVRKADGAESKLVLTVAIGGKGFYVAGAGRVLAADPGNGHADRSPTVPLKDGKYDYATLTAQLARIKAWYPRETEVILAADADVLFDTLIQTMDACREQVTKKPDGTTERRPLFFEVSLSVIG